MNFVDFFIKDKGGRKTTNFLKKMETLIPFKEIEKTLIEYGVYIPNKKRKGRPSIPSRILIGTIFLQSWYGLSDPQAEEQINDRLSFRQFLRISSEEVIPDETTICKFRNKLIEKGLLKKLFEDMKEKMIENQIIMKEGTLVDATLIHSSEPKRKKDKDGNVISNVAYDKEASYTSKRGRKYHGYKMHIATDKNGMIKNVIATTAKVSDITQIEDIVTKEAETVYADSAYMSAEYKKRLLEKGIILKTIERRVRGQKKLREEQIKNNKKVAKVRALVELPFAFIKKIMGFKETRYRGIKKNQAHFYLIALSYNLKRMYSLQVNYV